MMRFLSAVTVAGLLAGCPALAADLPSRLPPPTAPSIAPLPAFSWTGFYIGGNGGGGFLAQDVVGIHFDPGYVFVGNFGKLRPTGAFGGGQAGYNYQWGRVVFGAEADIQVADIGDKASVGLPPLAAGSVATKSQVDFFGTARVRLGYTFDRVLLYVTGGYSYGEVKYNLDAGSPASFNATIRDRSIHNGDAIGAGIEYAFSDHVTLKVEYQHIGLSGKTVRAPVLAGAAPTPFSIATVESPEFEIARIGINYKF